MHDIVFSDGIREFSVKTQNGDKERKIRFNPSDMGFLETLYGLCVKMDEIGKKYTQKTKNVGDDYAKRFEYRRAADKQIRDAVDVVFGDGFCATIFKDVQLSAAAEGCAVIENLVFAVIDVMDEDIKDNMAKREGRIAEYTEKYSKHKA